VDVEINVHKAECAGALPHTYFNDIIERRNVSHSDNLRDFSSCQNLYIWHWKYITKIKCYMANL